ncbi:MAG: apolipoprotein N-acyltransferase [Gammaproteobacteria bacterium]|jgi:apolipoprotein N-acyltransferase
MTTTPNEPEPDRGPEPLVPGDESALAPAARLVRMGLAWLLMVAASPGFLTQAGSLILACLGLSLWGATVLQPRIGGARWGFLAEALPNAIGSGSLFAWVWYVFPGAFLYVCLGMGLHWTLTAYCVRRLARYLPAGIAVALGVLALEGLRAITPLPFGIGWLQFGHYSHDHLWIAGSARLWGLAGLSWVVVSLAGLGSTILLGAERSARGEARLRRLDLLFGFGPLVLAILLSLLMRAPDERPGPEILLVQPGFTQERKQLGSPRENFVEEMSLTRDAVAELVSAGRAPDLVLWAESMLIVNLFGEGVPAAVSAGAQMPPWSSELTAKALENLRDWELDWVQGALFGEGPYAGPEAVIPPESAFLAGAEVFNAVGEGDQLDLRRQVCVALWGPSPGPGEKRSRSLALKHNLVPGAESMLGLERLGFVRDAILAVAGYVPDFLAGPGAQVLELHTTGGESWRFGAGICFDNAFLTTFTDVFDVPQEGSRTPAPLDFHLIASNEAWYRDSFEMDQMVALSRIAALATERSVVRVTNSGVSLVIGPDGVERGRVRDSEGRDRAIAGTLSMAVPVPLPGERGALSPYVRTSFLWHILRVLAPFLAILGARLGARKKGPQGASGTL